MSFFKDYIAKDDLRRLSRRSDLMGVWCVAHCWGVIIAAMAVFAVWPNPLTFGLGVIIIGSRQLGLAILMHEAAHRTLFKSPKLNDFIGQYLLAYPTGTDIHAYRKYHLTHHRYTQQDNDPDLILSAPFPVGKASLRRKLLRDVTGLTGIKQRVFLIQSALGGRKSTTGQFGFYASHLVIFSVCTLFGLWWLYFAMFLFPLLTWFQAVLRVRNIAEHALVSREADPLRNSRTTYANLIERALVAPYWVNYHVEHHAYIFIPCYNLKKAHQQFLDNGYKDQINTLPNYAQVLRLASSG